MGKSIYAAAPKEISVVILQMQSQNIK